MTTFDGLSPSPRDILKVSTLNRLAKTHLEQGFGLLWIEGEISNFAKPGSGHWYFSLKDQSAQVQCTMFRNRNMLVKTTPSNGQHVLIRARVTLYEQRGSFQLNVEHLEDAGEGQLQLAFEQLKTRLSQEGLFDQQRKRPIPEKIQTIGVITSPTGAAIKDVLTVLARRSPMISVIIYPAQVQGEAAAATLVDAIHNANTHSKVDVILLTRGGGSLEDLWPFNEEAVARAIVGSNIPVVSAVGHEVDFTIADLAADSRAPTPSAGAELLSLDQLSLKQRLSDLTQRLLHQTRQTLHQKYQRLDLVAEKIQRRSPRHQITLQRQHWLNLNQRLRRSIARQLQHHQTHLEQLHHRVTRCAPTPVIEQGQERLKQWQQRSAFALKNGLESKQKHLAHIAAALHQLSPLATLSRGYSISRNEKNQVISKIAQALPGKTLTVQVSDGSINATIVSTQQDQSD